jgi:hypothetical protein
VRTWWFFVFLIACKGAGAPTQGHGSGHAAQKAGSANAGSAMAGSADPWSKAPSAAPESPEQRKQRAEAALARVGSIMPKLAEVRQLTFVQQVPTEYQSTADFHAYLERDIAKELPPAKAKDESEAFFHIGLFTKPIDLAATIEQTMATQAGAYYDPIAKKFFLVMVPDSDLMLDTMSAHELTHGLQDQHFDLTQYIEPKGKQLDDDVSNARRFIVEGDATFTMLLYAIASTTGKTTLDPAMLGVLATQVKQFADMDISSFADMTKQNSGMFSSMDPDIKKSVEAMDSLPPAVLVPLIDSYTKGALLSLAAYQQGGWKAVDALYKNPPESTEQTLHPDKLLPTRDHPHKVVLPALGGSSLEDNVMGELMWQIYIALWTPKAGPAPSEGWGGDHYTVVRRPDGHLVAAFATIWDTPNDAKEFYDAYVATLPVRFKGADVTRPDAGVARSDFGKVWVKLAGAKVYIVDGGDDPKVMDKLVAGTKLD